MLTNADIHPRQIRSASPRRARLATSARTPNSHFGALSLVVTRLTRLHESSRKEAWQVSDAPDDFIKAQLRGIVGFRMPISRIDAKKKMSQNRKLEDRAGVIAGLGESDNPHDREVAALIPAN